MTANILTSQLINWIQIKRNASIIEHTQKIYSSFDNMERNLQVDFCSLLNIENFKHKYYVDIIDMRYEMLSYMNKTDSSLELSAKQFIEEAPDLITNCHSSVMDPIMLYMELNAQLFKETIEDIDALDQQAFQEAIPMKVGYLEMLSSFSIMPIPKEAKELYVKLFHASLDAEFGIMAALLIDSEILEMDKKVFNKRIKELSTFITEATQLFFAISAHMGLCNLDSVNPTSKQMANELLGIKILTGILEFDYPLYNNTKTFELDSLM